MAWWGKSKPMPITAQFASSQRPDQATQPANRRFQMRPAKRAKYFFRLLTFIPQRFFGSNRNELLDDI